MKKIIILGAGLLFAGLAQGQTRTANFATFGIKAGANFAKFTGTPDPNSNSNTGLAAGIFANIPISSGFSFEPSAEYSQKGAEFTTSTNSQLSSKISYIDIPFVFRYNLMPSFGLFAGPQVAFFVDQETTVTSGTGSTTFEGNSDSYRKSLAGGKAGASYNFGSVMLNASYATDFQNLYKDNTGNRDLKNQVINVGLGYRFK